MGATLTNAWRNWAEVRHLLGAARLVRLPVSRGSGSSGLLQIQGLLPIAGSALRISGRH